MIQGKFAKRSPSRRDVGSGGRQLSSFSVRHCERPLENGFACDREFGGINTTCSRYNFRRSARSASSSEPDATPSCPLFVSPPSSSILIVHALPRATFSAAAGPRKTMLCLSFCVLVSSGEITTTIITGVCPLVSTAGAACKGSTLPLGEVSTVRNLMCSGSTRPRCRTGQHCTGISFP